MKTIRQGDVLLVPVSALPKGAVEVIQHGDVILAYGEVTGHAHRIKQGKKSSARIFDLGAERYVQLLGAEKAGRVKGKIIGRDKNAVIVLHPVYGKTKFLRRDVRKVGNSVEALHDWSPMTHEEHDAVAISLGIYRQAFQFEEKRAEIQRVAD